MDKYIEALIKKNNSAFYVFDIRKLKKRIDYLEQKLSKNITLCYAVKANPFITKELKGKIKKFEICSPGEARICTSLGIDSGEMVISGINKTPSVIEEMISDLSFDGVVTVESLSQYRLIRDLTEKYNRSIRILPRLTNDSQFGINESDIENIISECNENSKLHIIGIQYFSGTQKTSIKKIKREIEYLDKFISELNSKYGFTPEELEYGSGFPVQYFENDSFCEDDYLSTFSEIIENMTNKIKITLELGRSIAASCGQYFTHIVDIKCNKDQNYALIDGGMHHQVYFGQYMAMKMPFFSVVGKTELNFEKKWTVCGSLCSMNDIVVKQATLPNIQIGDILCFENTGAYCMTEGIALFLTRDLPAVYLITENNELVCVRNTIETEFLNMPKYERIL